MTDLDKINFICNKLRRLDSNAADYVIKLYSENRLWDNWQDYYNSPEILGSLFRWSGTPQRTDYWSTLHNRYRQLKNITKLGNEL